MNENLDALLAEDRQGQAHAAQPFDRDEWAAKKKQERETLYALADEGAAALATDGEQLENYVSVQARFLRYSVTNALLITRQAPDATQLKDFDGWSEAGFSVRKGEKSIALLEPGSSFTREDGSAGTLFDVRRVFDVSQVQANEKDTALPSQETPAHEVDRALLRALIHNAPAEIVAVDTLDDPNTAARFVPQEKRILASRQFPPEVLFQQLAREIAHAEFARGQEDGYSRAAFDGQARCAAFLVCRRFGVDASCCNVRNVPAALQGLDPRQTRDFFSAVRDTAGRIAGRMDRCLESGAKAASRESR